MDRLLSLPSFLITAFNGYVIMLDAETGAERWRTSVPAHDAHHIPIRIHVRNEDVVALTSSALVVLWVADGSVRLSVPLPATNGTPTLLVAGDRAFTSSNGVASCIDLRTGEITWTNKLPGTGWGPAALAMPGRAAQGDRR